MRIRTNVLKHPIYDNEAAIVDRTPEICSLICIRFDNDENRTPCTWEANTHDTLRIRCV